MSPASAPASSPRTGRRLPAFLLQALVLTFALLSGSRAFAWVRDNGALWPSGTVTFKLMLGNTPLKPGGSTANQRAEAGITLWNGYLGRLQFATLDQGAGTGFVGNGSNEVWFADSYAGSELSYDVVGLTITRSSGGARREADIIVNSKFNWAYTETYAAYYGTLLAAVVHETGHALGLAHPADGGQSVRATMNPGSHFETLCDDDQEGAAALYGAGPRTHAVEFSKHPEGGEYEVGDSCSLVALSNAPTYQWYKDGVSLGSTPWANNSTYSFIATTAHAGVYKVVASNAWKSASSNSATVVVHATPQPPIIYSDLPDAVKEEGDGVMFQVSFRSKSSVSYRWFKDGVLLPNTWTYLSLSDLKPEDAGLYRVELTNSVGVRLSREARLTILPPPAPVITSSGDTKRSWVGGRPNSLKVEASGVHLTYSWFKDGKPVDAARGFTVGYLGVLQKTLWEAADSGVYHCVVSNRGGSATSLPITLAISELSLPSPWVFPSSVRVRGGDSDVVRALQSYERDQTTRYQWFKDGAPLRYHADSEMLVLTNTQISDSGVYWLEISNAVGSVRCNPISCQVYARSQHTPVAEVDGVLHSSGGSGWSLSRKRLSDFTSLPNIPLGSGAEALVGNSEGLVVAQRFSSTEYILRQFLFSEMQLRDLDSPFVATKVLLVQEPGSLLVGLGSCATGQAQLLRRDGATGARTTLHTYAGDTLVDLLRSAKSGRLYLLFTHTGSQESYSYVCSMRLDGSDFLKGPPSTSLPTGFRFASDERFLVDDAGGIRLAATLAPAGRLPFSPDDLVMLPSGGNLFLAQDRLLFYSADLSFQRGIDATPDSGRLFLSSGKVYACVGIHYVDWKQVDLDAPNASWSSQFPGRAPALVGAPLQPEAAFVGRDGLVYALDGGLAGLYAWSTKTHALTQVTPLRGRPVQSVHMPDLDCLFLLYKEGLVSRVGLQAGAVEEEFLRFGSSVKGIAGKAGRLAVFLEDSGMSTTCLVYDAQSAAQLGQTKLGFAVQDSCRQFWSPSQGLLVWPYGGWIGGLMLTSESAAGGTPGFDSTTQQQIQFTDPVNIPSHQKIYPNADGTQLLAQSGYVVDLAGRRLLGRLPGTHHFGLWSAAGTSRLYSLVLEGIGTRLNRWSVDGLKLEASVWLDCVGNSLVELKDGSLLVLGHRRGAPRLITVDASLNVVRSDGTGEPGRLVNLSIQADVGVGDDILVPGFVVKGGGLKNILVRAVGPGLVPFKVANVLNDPKLTLFGANSVKLAENDNWQGIATPGMALQRMRDLHAFDLPDGSLDAAHLGALPSGLYTAEARGKAETSGRALVEVYDGDEAAGDSRLVNLSARCKVTPPGVVIAGFVLKGDTPRKLLLRAIGPRLADYKVTGVLPDPKLTLFRDQTVLASADNWSADPEKASALEAAFESTGAFPLVSGSKDAALLVELEPGNYTVWMESADGGSGVALLEVYWVE